MEIEDRFELDIPINLVSDMTTVADLVALVDRQLKAREASDGHLRQVCTFRRRHEQLLALGADPFAVRLDESAFRDRGPDRRPARRSSPGPTTIWASPIDPACIAAARGGVRGATAPAPRARASPTVPTVCTPSSRPTFAQFLRRSCMVFSTGYQANLAMIAGLAGSRDVVLIDADSHASIYDACKLPAPPSCASDTTMPPTSTVAWPASAARAIAGW